ncbi:hypothetical protein BC940DRAFT_299702 [Gongronella butleri]|nr:hypothetical protein BC940DRAFT_299702 [Gongronella butleri]
MAKHHHHHHRHHENGNGHVKHTESNGQPTKEVEATEDSKTKIQFVSRVTSLPIVHDSVSTVTSLANKTSLGRYAFAKANSTLTSVSNYTASHQPAYIQSYYESYVQPHVERADQLGCRSLDLIQSRFPAVNEPAANWVPKSQVLDGVKVRLDSTLTTVRAPATYANKQLTSVVDNVEALVDRYLPSTDNGADRSVNGDDKAASTTKEDAADLNQVYRAYSVLYGATGRLTTRVSEQVKTTAAQVPRSRQDIADNTSALIQTATTNLQSLQAALTRQVTVYAEATQRKLPPAVTQRVQNLHALTTQQISALSTQVSLQLEQVVSFVKTQSPQPPQWLKDRVLSLVEIANKQFSLVKDELARTDVASIEKIKNVATSLQKEVIPILENIQSQLNHYSRVAREKAQADLKVPLDFLGLHLNTAAKTA